MQKGLSKIDQEWVPLQTKVFTRWVVTHLQGQSTVQVKDITTDLSDGVALVELAQILTGKETKEAWDKKPKSPYAKTQNCDLALKMFTQDGVYLVGISGKDVKDNNKKLTLGLIWSLILHYSIGKALPASQRAAAESRSGLVSASENALKTWAINCVKGYEYTEDFQPYDMSICALLDKFYPQEMNYKSLNPEKPVENLTSACKVMNHHNIDILVYPEDLEDNEIDEKTLLTQLSAIKSVVTQNEQPQVQSRSISLQSEDRSSSNQTNSSSQQARTTYTSSQTTNTTSSYTSSSQHSGSTQQTGYSSQQNSNFGAVRERSANIDLSSNQSSSSTTVNGDNSSNAGRRFALTMTLSSSEYNQLQTDPSRKVSSGNVQLTLTLVHPEQPYINPAGMKLDMTRGSNGNNIYEQFVFGKNEWNTVIDSCYQQGMVWDVANEYDLNPPEGTEFYLFPFHGRHNQHFVYQNKHIYATQNGQVVTYVGGDKPLVMRKQSPELNNRQTFEIRFV